MRIAHWVKFSMFLQCIPPVSLLPSTRLLEHSRLPGWLALAARVPVLRAAALLQRPEGSPARGPQALAGPPCWRGHHGHILGPGRSRGRRGRRGEGRPGGGSGSVHQVNRALPVNPTQPPIGWAAVPSGRELRMRKLDHSDNKNKCGSRKVCEANKLRRMDSPAPSAGGGLTGCPWLL